MIFTRDSLPFCSLVVACLALTFRGAGAQEPALEVTLRPGDIVKVEIWREPDLSGEFLVDERGVLTLPLLGEIGVRGLSTPQLRDNLIEAYRVQLRNPSIVVTPLRRVHVLGHVNRPDLYNVDPTMSLAGVVALAGGADDGGDLSKIKVFRGDSLVHQPEGAEATLLSIDVRSGDQIFVGRRGWFERNSTFVISALMSVTSLVISMTR